MNKHRYEDTMSNPWLLIVGFILVNVISFIVSMVISMFWYPMTFFESFGILTFGIVVMQIIGEIIEYYTNNE